jgi:hypothetical protein
MQYPCDSFVIAANGTGDTVITQNGTTVLDEPTDEILSLSITGGAAQTTIDFTHGDPLPAAGIYSDAQIIQLNGPHGSDPIITTSTAAYVGSDILRYPAGTQLADNLTSDGGIYAISGTSTLADPAGDALTVLTGATVAGLITSIWRPVQILWPSMIIGYSVSTNIFLP